MSAVKYTFGNDFDAPRDTGPSPQEIEHEKIKKAAYEEGYAAGYKAIDLVGDGILQDILSQSVIIVERHYEQIEMMQKHSANLAHLIIQKLAPALVENTPLDEIELLVKQCLKSHPLEPKIIIHLAESHIAEMTDKITKIKKQTGFEGEIKLVAENTNHISDCRVEWEDGGAERDFESLIALINNTVQLFLEAPISQKIEVKNETEN